MQTDSTPYSPTDFRKALGAFATGVTIVTTRAGEVIHGLTANAFCSLSLAPPLVLVCVDKKAQSHDLIVAGECFAINLLNAEQQPLSERFSQNKLEGKERYAGVDFTQAVTGAPILANVLSWLDCKLVATHDGGDHTIFVGEVVALGNGEEAAPLLYYRSQYRKLEA
ncbi:MAG: flavin reductase family protein [candidate division KSB1 bacterium]